MRGGGVNSSTLETVNAAATAIAAAENRLPHATIQVNVRNWIIIRVNLIFV